MQRWIGWLFGWIVALTLLFDSGLWLFGVLLIVLLLVIKPFNISTSVKIMSSAWCRICSITLILFGIGLITLHALTRDVDVHVIELIDVQGGRSYNCLVFGLHVGGPQVGKDEIMKGAIISENACVVLGDVLVISDSKLYVLCFIVGLYLLFLAPRIGKRSEQLKRYVELVTNQSITSVDDIASLTGMKHEEVMADLQRMIDANLFPGAYLHKTQRAIIFKKDEKQKASTSVSSTPGMVQKQEKVVVCPSCGADNKVMSGKVTECQYCGVLIQ